MNILLFTLVYVSLAVPFFKAKEPIPGSYLLSLSHKTSLSHRYNLIEKLQAKSVFHINTIHLLHVNLTENQLKSLAQSDLINYIEEDSVIYGQQDFCISESTVSWNLARISEGYEILKTQNYKYINNTGYGATSYIVDTGIHLTHDEFQGRAKFGANFVDSIDTDCNGHGTHVAGIVGGMTYGVAKSVELVSIKVLNCGNEGSLSNLLKALHWIKQNCTNTTKCNINISIGAPKSESLNAAIDSMVTEGGIPVIVAAGNFNQDACSFSPSSASYAITVGSTEIVNVSSGLNERIDQRSPFSNYGTCVSILAPGSSINSAWIGSNDAVNTMSGTSMASPHVSGVVSILQSQDDYSPSDLKQMILSKATQNVVNLVCIQNRPGCDKTTTNLLHSSC